MKHRGTNILPLLIAFLMSACLVTCFIAHERGCMTLFEAALVVEAVLVMLEILELLAALKGIDYPLLTFVKARLGRRSIARQIRNDSERNLNTHLQDK